MGVRKNMKCCVCQDINRDFPPKRVKDAVTIKDGYAYCKDHVDWYQSAGDAAYI